MNDKLWKITESVLNVQAVSGREKNITDLIKKYIGDSADEITNCGQGSLIAKIGNKGLKIMIDSHMDEVGFLISRVEKNGFIRFKPVGGWWPHVIVAKSFDIITRENKKVKGVVGSKPVHILKPAERAKLVKINDMYLDIGVESDKEVYALGINIGDYLAKDTKAWRMANQDYICGKSLDNRISVATNIKAFLEISKNKKNLKNTLYLTTTTQEEVGLRGAKTSFYKINPDIALIVDTTISADQPGVERTSCRLNNGISLEIQDGYTITNRDFYKYVENLCIKNKIKYSKAQLTGGGTNAGMAYSIKRGPITMVLSIPTRYLHTHNEVCSLNDAAACVELIKTIINDLNTEKFKSFFNK